MATPNPAVPPPTAEAPVEAKPARRVRMLQSAATAGECYHHDRTYDVADALATTFIAEGLAEEVSAESKAKGSKK